MGGVAGCGVSRPPPSCSADLGGSSNDSKDALGRLKWSKVPWEPRRAMGESVLRARLRLVGERRKGIRFAFLNHSIGEKCSGNTLQHSSETLASRLARVLVSWSQPTRPWKQVNWREGPPAGNARPLPGPCPEPGGRSLKIRVAQSLSHWERGGAPIHWPYSSPHQVSKVNSL